MTRRTTAHRAIRIGAAAMRERPGVVLAGLVYGGTALDPARTRS